MGGLPPCVIQVLLALLRDCSIADPLMSPSHSATGSVKNGK